MISIAPATQFVVTWQHVCMAQPKANELKAVTRSSAVRAFMNKVVRLPAAATVQLCVQPPSSSLASSSFSFVDLEVSPKEITEVEAEPSDMLSPDPW